MELFFNFNKEKYLCASIENSYLLFSVFISDIRVAWKHVCLWKEPNIFELLLSEIQIKSVIFVEIKIMHWPRVYDKSGLTEWT